MSFSNSAFEQILSDLRDLTSLRLQAGRPITQIGLNGRFMALIQEGLNNLMRSWRDTDQSHALAMGNLSSLALLRTELQQLALHTGHVESIIEASLKALDLNASFGTQSDDPAGTFKSLLVAWDSLADGSSRFVLDNLEMLIKRMVKEFMRAPGMANEVSQLKGLLNYGINIGRAGSTVVSRSFSTRCS